MLIVSVGKKIVSALMENSVVMGVLRIVSSRRLVSVSVRRILHVVKFADVAIFRIHLIQIKINCTKFVDYSYMKNKKII